MNYIEIKRVTDFLDFLVRSGNSGTAAEIADRLGVSERTVHAYFNQLKSIGVPLEFDRIRKTYHYTRSGRLILAFVPDEQDANFRKTATSTLPLPSKCAVKHKNIFYPEVWLQGKRFTLY